MSWTSKALRTQQLGAIAHAGRRKGRGGIDDAMAEKRAILARVTARLRITKPAQPDFDDLRAGSRAHTADWLAEKLDRTVFTAMRDELDKAAVPVSYAVIVPRNLFTGLPGRFNGITIHEAP